jgi:energy-coupling factor transporter ATP-binding protein EcfA2
MEDLKIICYADIEAEPVRWLWEPYIAKGKVSLIQGDGGSGKTTMAVAIAAAITTGTPLPGAENSGIFEPRNVVFQNAEDSPKDKIKPNLERFSADGERVFYIDDSETPLTFTDERIERIIAETGAVACFLDPTQAYLENLYNVSKVRAAMKHLAAVAERNDCAIVLVGHLTKKGGKSAYRGLGSIDIYAAARSVMTVGMLPSDGSQNNAHASVREIRVMVHNKSNLGARGAAQAMGLSADGEFIWLGEHDITVDEVMSGKENEKKESQFAKARRLLEKALGGGLPVPAVDIMQLADDEGISFKTFKRAKDALGVISIKNGGQWYWQLPIDVVYTDYGQEEQTDQGGRANALVPLDFFGGEST